MFSFDITYIDEMSFITNSFITFANQTLLQNAAFTKRTTSARQLES
jgi:hypothetical protein